MRLNNDSIEWMASHYQHPWLFFVIQWRLKFSIRINFFSLLLSFISDNQLRVRKKKTYLSHHKGEEWDGEAVNKLKKRASRNKEMAASGNTQRISEDLEEKTRRTSSNANGRPKNSDSTVDSMCVFTRLINFNTMIWARGMIDHFMFFIRHFTSLHLRLCVIECLGFCISSNTKEKRLAIKTFNACLILGEEVQFSCSKEKKEWIISRILILSCIILKRLR